MQQIYNIYKCVCAIVNESNMCVFMVIRYVLVVLCMLQSCGAVFGSKLHNVSFKQVRVLQIKDLKADIQFIASPDETLAIFSTQSDFQNLNIEDADGVVRIYTLTGSLSKPKLTIFIPKTCNVELSVGGNSHVFFPDMNAALKLTLQDDAELTLDGANGLILTLQGDTKAKIKALKGNAVISASNTAILDVGAQKASNIDTVSMRVADRAIVNVNAIIKRLKLETQGKSITQIYKVVEGFVWNSSGVEKVTVKNILGNASLTAMYHSRFLALDAHLDLLLAKTAATSKIQIKGTAVNANFTAMGASEITIDRVTGKVLGNSQRSSAKIRVLYP